MRTKDETYCLYQNQKRVKGMQDVKSEPFQGHLLFQLLSHIYQGTRALRGYIF